MDQVTQKNAAMVEETSAATHKLSQEAAGLTEIIAWFRLSDVPASAPAAQTPAPRAPAPRVPQASMSRPKK